MALQYLNNVKVGHKCTVVKLTNAPKIRARLMSLGIIIGAEIEVIKLAPLGDPIEIRIKDFYLSLRKNEAAQILVKYKK